MTKLAHNRGSIRLPGYDYSQPGAYFITICAHSRETLFGDILDGKIHPNPLGQIAQNEWARLPTRFDTIGLGEFIIMPNHIHGIIIITDSCRGAATQIQDSRHENPQLRSTPSNTDTNRGAADVNLGAAVSEKDIGAEGSLLRPYGMQTNLPPGSIGAVVRAYKSSVTRRINRTRFAPDTPIWQRNYYEHIIRNENEMNRIREYILDNPRRWAEDNENPPVGAKH